MLSDSHYYHRIIRKTVIGFGSIFNNIKLVRYTKDGLTEIGRITVPLLYADKEKFYQRITTDPELTKEVSITLPRISFDMNSIQFDPLRMTSQFTSQRSLGAIGDTKKSVKKTPYNFNFTVSIFVRNVEDGTQIIEQILPYFNPDYTLTFDNIDIPNLSIDVPVVLNDISFTNDAEGTPEETRVINWDITFTVKGYLYGPISDVKVIRKVTANTFYYNDSTGTTRQITVNGGSVDFKVGELVYEGTTINSANAKGFVESWNSTAKSLILLDTTGTLQEGRKLKGAISGAEWNVVDQIIDNYQLERLTVTPNPLSANSDDDYGFTETLTTYY